VDRSRQHRISVLRSQVRRERRDAAKVQTTVREHLQKHRMLEGGAGHGDPIVGLGLREGNGSTA
jgi:hypothetical protein